MKAKTSRVYAPLDRAGLTALLDDGTLPGPLDVHTVTPAVRDAFDDADEDDLEYAALWSAADAARAAHDSPARVVVVAADVPQGGLEAADDPERAYVARLTVPLARRLVVSLHVAEPDDGDDEELAWYDASEIADVLATWPLT